MSLINDALKKAQKQRTGDTPSLASMPSIGGEPAAKIAKESKSAGFNPLFLRLGLGAGALVVLVIGGYFAFRGKPETGKLTEQQRRWQSKPEGSESTQVSGLKTQVSPSSPQVSGLKSQVSEPEFTLPIAAPAPPSSSPAAKRPDEPAIASATAGSLGPPSAVNPQVSGLRSQVSGPSRPEPAAKFDNKAIDYIENLHIAGIRASATDSKVLMNDRVYRIGDMVDRDLGLKLVGITSSSLSFENEGGARYTRTF